MTFDFRGHGRSGGLSTLGDKEVNDLDVAVRYARGLGYAKVVTVGFSMGASVVLRQAALRRGVDAVVSVSGPGRWYYRDTEPMRRVHFAAEKRLGRAFTRHVLKTRISPEGWPVPDPMPPAEAAAMISPTPLLIVHGDQDVYFPPEHGQQLYDAAREPKEFWLHPRLRPRRALHRRRPDRPDRRLGGHGRRDPARALAQAYQLVGTGIPSEYPEALCTPTTACSANDARSAAPA